MSQEIEIDRERVDFDFSDDEFSEISGYFPDFKAFKTKEHLRHKEIPGLQWVRKNVYGCGGGDLKATLQRIHADHLSVGYYGLTARFPEGFLIISKKEIEENHEFLCVYFPDFKDYECKSKSTKQWFDTWEI